jgi:hypothetical protein
MLLVKFTPSFELLELRKIEAEACKLAYPLQIAIMVSTSFLKISHPSQYILRHRYIAYI